MRRNEARRARLLGVVVAAWVGTGIAGTTAGAAPPVESDYYRLETFAPEGLELEVTGLETLADGRLMLATRGGEVFVVEDPYGGPQKARFRRYAFGLATPLGLVERDGFVYTAQRGELTRMKDADGDGEADLFETVSDGWGLGGNYHEYAFGPAFDRSGHAWVTLNKPFGPQPYGRVHWRGWAVRIDTRRGTMQPVAVGLRSPSGLEASPAGEIFYTDNQGEWCNASKLSVLEPGDFHGHPWGLASCGQPEAGIRCPTEKELPDGALMAEVKARLPSFEMPAVWFPYDKMGKSPTGLRWDTTGGRFGPFAGQVFVGDQHHAWVMRVFLEKVNGHWQGAAFRFREGLQSGVVRLAFGKDGSLFVGETNAGWGSKGTAAWGLQRLVWSGKVPVEVAAMRARRDGFELTFTKPLDRARLLDAKNYRMTSYTYRLRSNYGGPEEETQTLQVTPGRVTNGGRTVRLRVTPLRPGYVHELHLDGLRTPDGTPLLHPEAYYTLVERPRR